jgi:hypothetical protein
VIFVHDDPAFGDLLRIVAARTRIAPGLVEKDYWVTHTLWALHDTGFEVWFKGGTSLSKGFGLIERFSEDLDLMVLPGTVSALPMVSNWKSAGARATAERRAYFAALPRLVRVPGAQVNVGEVADKFWRAADIRVSYAGRHLADLGSVMKPFVLLEVGSARATPAVRCDMTSFVHEYLAAAEQLTSFDDNRPKAVRCVHPLVTLLEKLDALHRRVPRADVAPATFVRHFEDAARVVLGLARLPPLPDYLDVRALADEMEAQRQLASRPKSSDEAFIPTAGERWDAIRAAYAAIAPMFWGSRVTLDNACDAIRGWIAETIE